MGVIFVSDGRPEERKDAIAQGLGHVALIAMHGVHHELQSGIDDAAGRPLALKQLEYLSQHFIKRHDPSSTCAMAASAWGSQNVISMDRYSSMAADRSARACSRRPILAYRVPRPL